MRPEIINRAGEAVAQGDRRLPVKPRLRQGDVRTAGGEEVVDAQHFVPTRQQPLAQVRPDEPGAAHDQYPFHRSPPQLGIISVCTRWCEVPVKEASGIEISLFYILFSQRLIP
jgi:hypothetical protein